MTEFSAKDPVGPPSVDITHLKQRRPTALLRDGRNGDLERQCRPHRRRHFSRTPRVDRLLKRRQPLPLRVFVGGDQSVRRLKIRLIYIKTVKTNVIE